MNSEYAERRLTRIFSPHLGELAGFTKLHFYNEGLGGANYSIRFTLRTSKPYQAMKIFDSLEGFVAQVEGKLEAKPGGQSEWLIDVASVMYLDGISKYWETLEEATKEMK